MAFVNRAQRAFSALSPSSICLSCRASQTVARPAFAHTFSTTARRPADEPFDSSKISFTSSPLRSPNTGFSAADALSARDGITYRPGDASLTEDPEPHHLHIVTSKHNTHLTLTRPDRNPIISIASGNIGFRKAGRGSYDAAYQLTAYLMSSIQDRGLLMEIKRLELVFSGAGDGRDAVKKALLGAEGMMIRNRIVRVTDATKLKFGGTRSPKPRRLG